jgi:hypothetical protein
MLNAEERKDKIRTLTKNLADRFNEILWSHPAKMSKLQKYRPSIISDFWTKYDELDKRLADYLNGSIEWEDASFQMEFTKDSAVPFPVLDVQPDVANFSRDLYCWIVLQANNV